MHRICRRAYCKCKREGINCITSDQKKILFHIFLASYVRDTLKSKNLPSVKRGCKTPFPCNVCTARRKGVQCYRICDKRTSENYRIFFRVPKGCLGTVKATIEKISKKSLLGLPSILANLPFSAVVKCVATCSVFRIEPMHVFSLGISKML